MVSNLDFLWCFSICVHKNFIHCGIIIFFLMFFFCGAEVDPMLLYTYKIYADIFYIVYIVDGKCF